MFLVFSDSKLLSGEKTYGVPCEANEGGIGYAIGFAYGASLGALVRACNWMYDNAFPERYPAQNGLII